MSLLEGIFKKCVVPDVQSFIPNEFKGLNRYQTKCKKCGKVSQRDSSFSELELSIAGNKTIGECLRSLVKEEILSGDNKYDCEKCGLVDATRKLCLVTLPPVLNIQLLRFVYDAETGTKKKLHTPLTFGRTLEMKPFLDASVRTEALYELSAVLLHLGNSANGGHYISHVLDEVGRQWWKFDDSSVTLLEPKDVGDIEPQMEEERDKGTRERALGLLSSLKSNTKITSENAYMLVYTLKHASRGQPPIPTPPMEIETQVEKANAILLKKVRFLEAFFSNSPTEER